MPAKCPAQEKKMRQEKKKKRGGEKVKKQVKTAVSLFKPENYLEIFLSVNCTNL